MVILTSGHSEEAASVDGLISFQLIAPYRLLVGATADQTCALKRSLNGSRQPTSVHEHAAYAPASAGLVCRSSRAQAIPSAIMTTALVSKVGTLPTFLMPNP